MIAIKNSLSGRNEGNIHIYIAIIEYISQIIRAQQRISAGLLGLSSRGSTSYWIEHRLAS
jgi:hypothetical protein